MKATPDHTCRFMQSYSSWSCSPAELHYASDCGAKIYNCQDAAIKNADFVILQFDPLKQSTAKLSCNLTYTPKTLASEYSYGKVMYICNT